MRLQAVVFDLFITLTDFDAERGRRRFEAELATALGVDPAAFSSLMRATFTARATAGLGDSRATLATLAAQLGGRPSEREIDAIVALRYEQQRQLVTPRAGVIEALSAIRRAGYAIGILTDCTSEVFELWPLLPYAAVVDAVTFSCEVGHRKPDPAGYHDIAHKLGVAPAECVYVGDGASDELRGAANVGMTAILIDTPFDDSFRYDAKVWAGPSIRTLEELRGFLRQMEGGLPNPGD